MNVARLILVTFLISHCVHTAIAQDCMEAARKAKEWMSKYGTYEFTQDGPTVGIELEGILPRHFTYTDLRDGVKNAFKEQLSSQLGVTQIEVIDGTDHRGNTKALLRYVKGGHTYTWEFKHDYSVESKDVGMQDIEIASPVLRNKEDFDFYFSVIDFLKSKFGLQAEPYTGGFTFISGSTRRQ